MRNRIKALLGATLLCSLFAFAGQASAAETCPNEAIREEQHATSLPECRAYEQVSPVDKGGYQAGVNNHIRAEYGVARADGDAMSYRSTGPFPGAQTPTSGMTEEYVAKRSAGGWSSQLMLPTPLVANPSLSFARSAVKLSSDFSKSLVDTGLAPLVAADENETYDTYLVSVGDLATTWLSQPTTTNPIVGNTGVYATGSTPDMSRVYFSAAGIPPGSTEQSYRYYEWSALGGLKPIDLLPGGGVSPGGATSVVTHGEDAIGYEANGVSADGMRVLFYSPQANSEQRQIYDRLVDTGETRLVSKSELTGLPGLSKPFFKYASADGKVVYFEDEGLTAGTSGRVLYRYNVDSDRVEYVIGLEDSVEIFGMSDDGNRFLYVAYPGSGKPVQLRLWDHGTVTKIADLGVQSAATKGALIIGARTNTPGSVYLFRSAVAAIGGGKFNNGGGFQQVYRYQVGGEIECLSCPDAGVTPSSDAAISADGAKVESLVPSMGRLQAARGMSSDGSRVFFQTAERLLPADSNNQSDVYEWRQGKPLRLITSGQGEHASYVLDNSADGNDVFIVTAEPLAPSDVDTDYDIYDVRVDGGFPAPPATRPCARDACRGEASSAPAAPLTGSASFGGLGNQAIGAGVRHCARRDATKAKKLRRRAHRLGGRARHAASGKRARRLRRQARRLRRQASRHSCQRPHNRQTRRGGQRHTTHRHG